MRIAVIGTGTMGSRIVSLLKKSGHEVFGFDPSETAQELARVSGAELLASPGEALEKAEIVFLSLPKPEHVRSTVGGEQGVLKALSPKASTNEPVIIDTSTVDPDTSREMAVLANARGAAYLDAPILGRPEGIGSWVMPVGGDPAVFQKVKSLLEIVAKRAVHIGPVGSGNKFKLINQLMFASVNMVYCEVFSLAEKSGIGADTFLEVLADSGASTVSGLFRELGRRVTENDFQPDFSVDLLAKDLKLASDFISSFDGATSITGLTLPLARMAQAAGLGEQDNAAVYRLFIKHFQGA